jgi:hypothetical protein
LLTEGAGEVGGVASVLKEACGTPGESPARRSLYALHRRREGVP